jgi:hypothetical protein
MQNSTEELHVSREKTRAKNKRKQGIRKYLSRNTSSPHLRLGGLCYEEGGNSLQRRRNSTKLCEKEGTYFIYFLEPIPKNFGYSLGGYSHRECCRAPDRRKSTKKGRKEAETGDTEKKS